MQQVNAECKLYNPSTNRHPM